MPTTNFILIIAYDHAHLYLESNFNKQKDKI